MTCTDITKEFESILTKHRKLRGEQKDILRNRKRSEYSRQSAAVTKAIAEAERQVCFVSGDDLTFLNKVRNLVIEVSNLSDMAQVEGNSSQVKHREVVSQALDTKIKAVSDKYAKVVRAAKSKGRLAKKAPRQNVISSRLVQGENYTPASVYKISYSRFNDDERRSFSA